MVMKILVLTDEQRNKLVRELYGMEGDFDIFVQIDDDIEVEVEGYAYSDGYRELDYWNGTGAWVTTGRDCDIKAITACVDYPDRCEDVNVDGETYRQCREALKEF